MTPTSGSIVLARVAMAVVQRDTASTADTSLAAGTPSVGYSLASDLVDKSRSSNRNAAGTMEVQLHSHPRRRAEATSTARVCNRFPSNTRNCLSCLRSYSVVETRDMEISDSMSYIAAVRNRLPDQPS